MRCCTIANSTCILRYSDRVSHTRGRLQSQAACQVHAAFHSDHCPHPIQSQGVDHPAVTTPHTQTQPVTHEAHRVNTAFVTLNSQRHAPAHALDTTLAKSYLPCLGLIYAYKPCNPRQHNSTHILLCLWPPQPPRLENKPQHAPE